MIAINASIKGMVDATKNLYATVATNGVITPLKDGASDSNFVFSSDTKFVTMPYYTDAAMTTLSGGITLKKSAALVYKRQGLTNIDVDNINTIVSMDVADGRETVELKNTIVPDQTWELYTDFMLTHKLDNKKIDITDEITRAYIVATDPATGASTKYDLVLKANTDKTKCELRKVFDELTYAECNYYTVNGDTITVNLPSKITNFPFSLVVSPSATYKIYTDAQMTKLYNDETYYFEPKVTHTFYVRITSGDGNSTKDMVMNITRPGTADHDARIISVVSPEQDILVFNNERKTIAYRPYAMVSSARFDFVVSKNATYEIYRNYNAATGEFSDLLSSQSDVKDIPIGDALSKFYVRVKSNYEDAYTTVYELNVYNDVKSDDNIITGITGVTDMTISADNVIRIKASSTLTNVNAHFETNEFADVTVYADENKIHKLTPGVTMDIVNNREVEVRTFKLGLTACVSYFYVDVTSETGRLNSYKVIVSKGSTSVPFSDIDTSWAKDYINEAARMGIVNGWQNSETGIYTFMPNDKATRQQMAIILCRMMGVDEVSFKDLSLSGAFTDADSIDDWAYNHAKACYKLGFMKGSVDEKGDTVFKPKDRITRQEFFQAIVNVMHLDVNAAADYSLDRFVDASSVSNWAVPATKAIVKAGIIEGDSSGRLNPRSDITRAEIAKIITLINKISADV